MREYEVTVIFQSQLEEGERDKLVERIENLIAPDADDEAKPEIDAWGLRRLAYPIQDYTEGFYVLYKAQIDPSRITEIERSMQYMEDVLRYLVVRIEN